MMGILLIMILLNPKNILQRDWQKVKDGDEMKLAG
jgi:hypothetical protein